MRALRLLLAGTCSVLFLAGCTGESSPTAHVQLTLAARPGGVGAIPRGAILAVDLRNRLLVLDRRGRLLRHVGRLRTRGYVVQGVDLAPDRRHAFIAVYRSAPERDGIYELDFGDGSIDEIGVGLSPAVSPDGSRLAYLQTGPEPADGITDWIRWKGVAPDIKYRTGLVIRDLESGRERFLAFVPGVPATPPPGMIVNWAPDGRRIALVEDREIKVVGLGAEDVASVPATRGAMGLLAPVFVDNRTLVALDGCCTGPQRLVALDLFTGRRSPFVQLSSPPEAIRRQARGTLLLVTAFGNELAFVERGRTRTVGSNVSVASD